METADQKLRKGTYNPNEGQALWWSMYDRLIFDSAGLNPTEYTYFTERLGENGKTRADTNVKANGQIPTGMKFEATMLEWFYVPNAAKTAAEIQNMTDAFRTGWFIFNITSKSNQLELPMTQAWGNPFPIVLNQVSNELYGRSGYTGRWELPIPIVLAADTSFDATINFSVAPNASLDTDLIYLCMVGPLVTLQ